MLDFYLQSFSPVPKKWGPKLTREMTRLGLNAQDQCAVLKVDLQQWQDLVAGVPRDISCDTNLRALYSMGIAQLLADMSDEKDFGHKWLNLIPATPPFNGHSPKELLCSGELDDIQTVYEIMFRMGFH